MLMDRVLQKLEIIERKVDAIFDILGEMGIEWIEEEELTEEELKELEEAIRELKEGKAVPLEEVLHELEGSS